MQFGDNDTLSAIVSSLVGADLLILLSDIDGLFTDDPHKNPDAKLIKVVDKIDTKLLGMAKGSTGSDVGTGGMATMEQSKIDRINELYRKSKAEGLTEAEKKEQALLRKQFVADVKKNLTAQLNNIDIQNEDGTIENLGEKYGNKSKKLS